MRFSRGALATDGSCRTVVVRMKHVSVAMVATYRKSTRGQYRHHIISQAKQLTAEVIRSSRTMVTVCCPVAVCYVRLRAVRGAERGRRVATYDGQAERLDNQCRGISGLGSTLRIWSSWHNDVSP
jgi:hypothetical protein